MFLPKLDWRYPSNECSSFSSYIGWAPFVPELKNAKVVNPPSPPKKKKYNKILNHKISPAYVSRKYRSAPPWDECPHCLTASQAQLIDYTKFISFSGCRYPCWYQQHAWRDIRLRPSLHLYRLLIRDLPGKFNHQKKKHKKIFHYFLYRHLDYSKS